MNPHFVTKLHCHPLPDGNFWRLDAPLKFMDSRGDLHLAPKGFRTDFASIPPLSTIAGIISAIVLILCGVSIYYRINWLMLVCMVLTAIVHAVIIISESLTCDDQLDAPAVIHDDGYSRPRLGRSSWRMKFYWDNLLLEAMCATKRPLWKRQLIYWNVTFFGWGTWIKDGKRNGIMNDDHRRRQQFSRRSRALAA